SLNEIEDKIRNYSDDIIYSDKRYTTEKVNQFMTFLFSQNISRNILHRIDLDYQYIKELLPPQNHNYPNKNIIRKVKSLIVDREVQGGFGFLVINQYFEVEKKYENHYIDAVPIWYNIGGDYNQRRENFLEYFFKPFI